MEAKNRIYCSTREEWRKWLSENFDKEKEIWLIIPHKSSGKPAVLYNDAVEEALCFCWIDSTGKSLDEYHSMQRYTPRRPKSSYSQANKERLKWLRENNMIHPKFRDEIDRILADEFVFPADIMAAIKENKEAWKNFQSFTESYKRIRVAYIDGARQRPEQFKTRLDNFIAKTADNKVITGHGGIGKYY
jgi:uncharacterized protein YdeI (YjbR/CyaY-like superfamily)